MSDQKPEPLPLSDEQIAKSEVLCCSHGVSFARFCDGCDDKQRIKYLGLRLEEARAENRKLRELQQRRAAQGEPPEKEDRGRLPDTQKKADRDPSAVRGGAGCVCEPASDLPFVAAQGQAALVRELQSLRGYFRTTPETTLQGQPIAGDYRMLFDRTFAALGEALDALGAVHAPRQDVEAIAGRLVCKIWLEYGRTVGAKEADTNAAYDRAVAEVRAALARLSQEPKP